MFHYYIIGNLPIKVTCNDADIPIRAEIIDFASKKFVKNLSLIPKIVDDNDYKEIDYVTFCNACLALGVAAI